MSTNERPPLWRALPQRMGAYYSSEIRAVTAMQIRVIATYIETHGLINTISQPTPRSGPRLLALLEEEARRAERGD